MIDVCLILEGSYPYVTGGVSTWVHDVIQSMKDIRFGIVYIAPNSDPTRMMKYELPDHVIYFREIYLHDYQMDAYAKRKPTQKDIAFLVDAYHQLFHKKEEVFPELLSLFRGEGACFDLPTFFSSEAIWNQLKLFYRQYGEEISFIDFFWTWRGTHLPLLQILNADLPRAKLYHSISTGYAGLLGSIAKLQYGEKFFLTEHGIYTHERLLEISQATWIYEKEKRHFRPEKELSLLKRWWVGVFQIMSRLTYRHADRIFTLYEGNKMREILDGADSKKISIISNGILMKEFDMLEFYKKEKPQVAFIGRVVTIKDVKTYILAADLVLKEMPEVQFHIIGPTDEEEEEYYEECVRLIDGLHLEEKILFQGQAPVKSFYTFLDLVVLTSISEAQPYAVLEANASGIPVVASDVGACREMLEGKGALDQLLGKSGLITEVGNPESTAAAILKLLRDKAFYQTASEAGKKRVRKYYDVDDLRSRYLNIYEQNL